MPVSLQALILLVLVGFKLMIEEPRIQHVKALAAALPALSLHGLRRFFGTLSEWVEVPAGIVAQIMGHKPSAIAEKHYIQRELDLLHLWHVKIEAWILEQVGIEFAPAQAVCVWCNRNNKRNYK